MGGLVIRESIELGNERSKLGGLGLNSGGGGEGFKSGSEHHIGTIECHVVSSSPHSQGELILNSNKKITFFHFPIQKMHTREYKV